MIERIHYPVAGCVNQEMHNTMNDSTGSNPIDSPSPGNHPATAANGLRMLAATSLLLPPVAALGTRFGLWPIKLGLLLVALAVAGCVLVLLAHGLWLFLKPNQETRRVLRWASLLALPPVVVLLYAASDADNRAGIHNISTDTQNPPAFVAGLTRRGEHSNPVEFTEATAVIQRQHYPDIDTIHSTLTPAEAYARALQIANELGWEVYAEAPDQGRIEAVETTLWFGFKDDVVIRIAAGNNGGSLVDLHSVSRVGKGDVGVNAKRIRKFRELFNAR